MADRYRVIIPRRVLDELDAIFDHIRQSSPQGAANMIRCLLAAIDSLDAFPHRFAVPRVGPALDKSVRSMPVRPYLVRYRIHEAARTVYVIRVRHGHRRQP
jgi:plasmid stabilization system protein ParE